MSKINKINDRHAGEGVRKAKNIYSLLVGVQTGIVTIETMWIFLTKDDNRSTTRFLLYYSRQHTQGPLHSTTELLIRVDSCAIFRIQRLETD